MKKIFFIFIFNFFLFNVSFAENLEDLYGTKKGSMDFHYKCVDDLDSSNKYEFGIKKIGNNKFVFDYHLEEKIYLAPLSSLIEYKRKIQGQDADISFFYGIIYPDLGFGGGIQFHIILSMNNNKKNFMQKWFIKNDENSTNEIINEYDNIIDNYTGKKLEESLIKLTENYHNIISKKLDFGEPFEYVDLVDYSKDAFMLAPNGGPINFLYKCKIKK